MPITDIALSHLAADVVDLRAELDSYRALAQQAIHALADADTRIRSLEIQLQAMRDELRRYVSSRVQP